LDEPIDKGRKQINVIPEQTNLVNEGLKLEMEIIVLLLLSP
jgi:hypothetical protein